MVSVRITITSKVPVVVKCECGMEGLVADLEAAVHWAFCEGLRHGRGCSLDILVEYMLHVEHVHASGQPANPT
jgi:hypothetical protein